MSRVSRITDLPESILLLIAQMVPTCDRRRVLPLVSKFWEGLLGGTSSAWESVSISDVDFHEAGEELDTVGMLLWFCRRAGAIKTLQIVGNLPTLSCSMLTSILVSQSTSLRELHLILRHCRIDPADLAVLAALTALEKLSISLLDKDEDAWTHDSRSVLLRMISSLPALVSLQIRDQDSFCTVVPSLGTLAKLQSTTLTSLYVTINHSLQESVLTLGDLPRLIILEIEVFIFSDEALHVPESAFEGMLSLAELSVQSADSMLLLTPACLIKLTMLSVLKLKHCDLQAVPEALLGVKAFLRQLDLSYNPDLQISQAGFDILLSLPALELIDLRKENVSWNMQSLRFLVKYLSVWHTLYPGSKQPSLDM